jgi:hypothetical protein
MVSPLLICLLLDLMILSDDCNGDVASELEWFKIGEEVQNQGDWAMQTVIETGKWSFKIPEDLKSG